MSKRAMKAWRQAFRGADARVKQLTEQLLEIEWAGSRYIGMETCPVCAAERSEGHQEDCSLRAVLVGEPE